MNKNIFLKKKKKKKERKKEKEKKEAYMQEAVWVCGSKTIM